FCEAIWIHDNRFVSNGKSPAGLLGQLVSLALGSPLPDILYDGIVDPKKVVGGSLPEKLAICIRNNGEAGFANFDGASLSASAVPIATKAQNSRKSNIVRDLNKYGGKLTALEPVSIVGVQ